MFIFLSFSYVHFQSMHLICIKTFREKGIDMDVCVHLIFCSLSVHSKALLCYRLLYVNHF